MKHSARLLPTMALEFQSIACNTASQQAKHPWVWVPRLHYLNLL